MRRATPFGAPALRRWLLLWCLAVCCAVSLSACTLEIGQPQVVSAKDAINVPIQVQRLEGGGVDVLVAVMIDGKGPYTFVVDTGAESSLVDTSLKDQLGLQQVGRSHQIGGIGGSERAVPVSIARWSMGQVRLPPSTIDSASVQDLSGSNTVGLLGSDVLSQFGNITINYDLNMLTVYKQIVPDGG